MVENNNTDKKPTSKSIKREIERLRKINAKRAERLAVLKKEISETNTEIKGLVKLYETIYQTEVQAKVAREWIKGTKMTEQQILKLLEVGRQIHDKIDDMETGAVVEAVTNAQKKQTGVGTKPAPAPQVIEAQEKDDEENAVEDGTE
jgi:hypothetical protein